MGPATYSKRATRSVTKAAKPSTNGVTPHLPTQPAIISTSAPPPTAAVLVNMYPANPHTGRRAGIKPTDLFSLATEIRMQIFSYSLVEKDPIPLDIERYFYQHYIVRVRSKRKLGTKTLDPILGLEMTPTPTKTSILSVCKALTDEAAEVLYGQNVFHFRNTTALAEFLNHLGDQKIGYLRFLSIASKGYIMSSAPQIAAKLLLNATNLRCLTFSHVDFCEGRWYSDRRIRIATTRVAKTFGEMLRVLQKHFDEEKIKISALDVIQIRATDHAIGGCREFGRVRKRDMRVELAAMEVCNGLLRQRLRETLMAEVGFGGEGVEKMVKEQDVDMEG